MLERVKEGAAEYQLGAEGVESCQAVWWCATGGEGQAVLDDHEKDFKGEGLGCLT